MKVLGWITTIVVLLVLGPVWSGYILSVLWAWFIVPTFHLPFISIPLSIGIGVVVRILVWQIPDQKDSKGSDTTKVLLRSMGWTFLYPLFVLFFAYIVHLFV